LITAWFKAAIIKAALAVHVAAFPRCADAISNILCNAANLIAACLTGVLGSAGHAGLRFTHFRARITLSAG
jgi:hypothetical protein